MLLENTFNKKDKDEENEHVDEARDVDFFSLIDGILKTTSQYGCFWKEKHEVSKVPVRHLDSEHIFSPPAQSLHETAVYYTSYHNEKDQTQNNDANDLVQSDFNLPVRLLESQESHR